MEAVEAVLTAHTPKNVEKRKARSGRKVPEGAGRFDPTSEEWREILNPPQIEKLPLKKKNKK